MAIEARGVVSETEAEGRRNPVNAAGSGPAHRERRTEVAIIGMGAWGLAVMERLFAAARARGDASPELLIHVIEPDEPGAGVYWVGQPEFLLMNTPCGQIALYPDEPGSRPLPYQVGLLEWARSRGYSWHGDRCQEGAGGIPLSEGDFLPRRVAGRYLQWFYQTLMTTVPSGVRVVHHRQEAIDLRPLAGDRELITLQSGRRIEVDQVVLTTGHTGNQLDDSGAEGTVDPYSVLDPAFQVSPQATVAVCGMGLVATDVLAGLTVGRGGEFVRGNGGLQYRASGREPRIQLLSRTGLPYCAKAVGMKNVTTSFEPAIWTEAAVAALRRRSARRGSSGLNWEGMLFPLLAGEMTLQYYTQASLLEDGPDAAALLRGQLARSWYQGEFQQQLGRLEPRFGRFDPVEHFRPDLGSALDSSADYQEAVRGMVAGDLREAERSGGTSPIKMAYEVLRFLRDPIRRAVEFGGLDEESHRAFFPGVSSQMTRLVAGPPAIRSRQLLALVDAGLVGFPYGPSPLITATSDGGAEISSSRLRQPHSEHVDLAIRGFVEAPVVDRSASLLIQSLHRQGRLRRIQFGGRPAAGVDLTRDSHPITSEAEVQGRLWVYGALTEGARYFTNCIPSPGSRRWSFEEAQRCASQILGAAAAV